MSENMTPESILKLGLGFWGSKTLLSAVELGVFTKLAGRALDHDALRGELGLHERSARDFFDALVALGMLERKDGRYNNAPTTEIFLDRNKPSYVGGILEMANARLYGFWGSLTEGLKTGEPQNEAKTGGDLFGALYADPARLEGFLESMSGLSRGASLALARALPWGDYQTVCDVGAAQGDLLAQVTLAHPHLTATGFDLPVVRPVFDAYIASLGLSSRVSFAGGDFFQEPLPRADVITMGHILHDWDLAQKKMLVRKAFEALPVGGSFVVFEAMIDDDRSRNTFGLLMSLNMLIETRGGFDYTTADCASWMKEAGFAETRVQHLVGPDSMVIGIK
ncbi:MAG: methyltransferase [Polyangiales bacterium]